MNGKNVRLSQQSLLDIIRNQRLEIERLKKENIQCRQALELAHRNIKGVAKQLSHFAGAKVEPDS